MNKFKISVSKGSKKYTLILSNVSEMEARDRVHKEGYSILNIEEINEEKILGHKYIFEVEKDGNIKKGKILGDDIFKIYLKLKKDLGYNVIALYTEKTESLNFDEKQKIIKELTEEYNIYTGQEKKTKGEQLKEDIEQNRINKKNFKKFFLKKELDITYSLINIISEEIIYVLSIEKKLELNDENKEDIKQLYNSIIKIKKTTNISKLKEVGESALLKIGELELNSIEKNKDIEIRKLLKNTNKLLKKIGSKHQFIEKNKDIGLMFSNFLDEIINNFLSFVSKINIKKSEDKISYSYIKNERLLKKYEEKLNLNTKEIIKNVFSSENREKLLLKRKVIKQNILLLLTKKKGISFFSYFIKRGYNKILEKIFKKLEYLRRYMFYAIVLYSLILLFYINNNTYDVFQGFNYRGVLYFIFLCIFYIIFSFSKRFIIIVLNFSLFSFLVLLGIINF